MTLSYNWIKEYLETTLTPAEMAERLVELGLEVESTEAVGGLAHSLDGVVVGHVLSAEQHPNADRLRVCQVDLGDGTPVQIVCGAPNVAAGQKVPVATIGAVLHPIDSTEPLKIKKGKIRGEESNGMICAEDELGLGKSHDGILVLDAALPAGTPFADTLKLDTDTVFEIGLTPNRVDGASHYGTARDLAASLRTFAQKPALAGVSFSGKNPIIITVQNADKCPLYTGIYIAGVTVADSPEWLQNRLKAVGLRPKNNIVDITNYVLHALGQPLHAFDADTIAGGEIVVRTLAADAAFTTLDGTSRALKADSDLLICDAEKPLCLAGIMGGQNSGTTESTVNVFLESAYFDAGTVRRTAKRLGISSDSSFRFERGADGNMAVFAAKYAAKLIVEIAGGTASELSEVRHADFPPFEVSLSYKKAIALIGKDIPKEEVIAILQHLEIETQLQADGDTLLLKVPSYRVDVKRPQDVVEEILRVYGYNNIEIPNSLHHTLDFGQYRDITALRHRYCDYLSANGYYEVLNNSLIQAKFATPDSVHLLNPLSDELGIMRPTLLYGILETLQFNQNRQQSDLKVYEWGKTYAKSSDGYAEREWLVLAITGQHHAPHWTGKGARTSIYTLTREAERLQSLFGFAGEIREMQPDAESQFAYGVELAVKKHVVARYGCISPRLTAMFDLKQEVCYMEIDWAVLLNLQAAAKFAFAPIPQFPGTRRDVSMLLTDTMQFAAIRREVLNSHPLIRSVSLHDVYMGDKLPAGKKSYLLSLELRDDTQTLADAASDKVMERVFGLLEKQFGAEIRK